MNPEHYQDDEDPSGASAAYAVMTVLLFGAALIVFVTLAIIVGP